MCSRIFNSVNSTLSVTACSRPIKDPVSRRTSSSFREHLRRQRPATCSPSENPNWRGLGCAAPAQCTSVALIDPSRKGVNEIYPCFEHPTLMDSLDAQMITWRYYAPSVGSIWTGPNRNSASAFWRRLGQGHHPSDASVDGHRQRAIGTSVLGDT